MYKFSCWLPDRIPKGQVRSSVHEFVPADNVAFAANDFVLKLQQLKIELRDGERICVSDVTGYIHFGDIRIINGTCVVKMR
jgi:hypothetical protein